MFCDCNYFTAKRKTRATSTKPVRKKPEQNLKRKRSESIAIFNINNNKGRKEKRTQYPTYNGKTTANSSKRVYHVSVSFKIDCLLPLIMGDVT